MVSILKKIVAAEENEIRPMLWATTYFFLVLAAYFVIRPIRDEMGVAGGVRNLPWLFLGTLLGMILIHPLFTALVSRVRRRLFIPLSYTFFAANLVAFWLLFRLISDDAGIWAGRVFFVWTSVFNLFVVSIFWSLMADLFRPGQAKRLFGFVAVGGTVGAVAGSSITAFLAARVGPTNLLLVSAAILGLAMFVARRLIDTVTRNRLDDDPLRPPTAQIEQPVGGGVFDGIRTVFASHYLLGIVAYMLLYTVTATIL
jgi:AAA family ATP:ADP antiporter